MADAWTTLFGNSTLGSGHDAWEHLNAQQSGGVTIEYLDRYISDKNISFKLNVNPVKVKIKNIDSKIKVNLNNISFTKKYKKNILKKKQVDIVFKVEQVIT